jgi:hypothetical protein
MKKVYIVHHAYPMFQGSEIVKIFEKEEDARIYAMRENDRVSPTQVYDEYGLVEGEEYIVQAMELE